MAASNNSPDWRTSPELSAYNNAHMQLFNHMQDGTHAFKIDPKCANCSKLRAKSQTAQDKFEKKFIVTQTDAKGKTYIGVPPTKRPAKRTKK